VTDAPNRRPATNRHEDVLRGALALSLGSEERANEALAVCLRMASIPRIPDDRDAFLQFVRGYVLAHVTQASGPRAAWNVLERVERASSGEMPAHRPALAAKPITTSDVVRVRVLVLEPDRVDRSRLFHAMSANRIDPTVVEEIGALEQTLRGPRRFHALVADGGIGDLERVMTLLREHEHIALALWTNQSTAAIEELVRRHTPRHWLRIPKDTPRDEMLRDVRRLIARSSKI